MAKYRKKSVVIEAVQFTGKNKDEIAKFVGESFMDWTNHPGTGVVTLGGDVKTRPDDWIIKSVQGDLYRCTSDRFKATYELVEEQAACVDSGYMY